MRCIRNPLLFYIVEESGLTPCPDGADNATWSLPRPLVDGDVVVGIFRAQILGARADQAVIVQLFDDVSSPTTHPRNGEDGCKQVYVDPQRVISGGRVKIDIGVQLLVSLHKLFDLARNLKPLGLTACTPKD